MQDWLAGAARGRPDHPALAAEGTVATYAQLDERAARLAEEIEPGRIVPVGARSGIEFAALLHATWRAGAVAVPLEPGAEAPAGLDPPGGSALVILTSGTTGEPQPVALTLANLEASAGASADAFPLTPGDRWLCPLPLTRIAGLSVLVRCAIAGATAVIHDGFDAARLRDTLEAGEVTLVSLVPTMLVRLREAGLERTPGLRAIVLGGGPIPPGLLEWADEAGIPVVPVYGMTESASQVTAGSPGRPLAGVELAVAADGEVLVRGAMVAPGARDAEGWLHTGDLGRLEDGLLRLEGRKKDLIVTGGVNVAPLAIENALMEHPQVAEAGVAGLPDPVWGEAVTAFVVPEEGARPGEEELRDWCRGRLPAAAVPKRVELTGSLPRNEAGKLLRDRLIESRAS